MITSDSHEEPYPNRIIDDIGLGYAGGVVYGSVLHFLMGMHNSPNGQRFIGATQALRKNCTRCGGQFATWSAIFSTFEYALLYLRQKDDPFNKIISSGAGEGFITMREGRGPACRMALYFGVGEALFQVGAATLMKKLDSSLKETELAHERFLKKFEAERLEKERKKKVSNFLVGKIVT